MSKKRKSLTQQFAAARSRDRAKFFADGGTPQMYMGRAATIPSRKRVEAKEACRDKRLWG
jgi:hypothetical protein